MSKTKTLFACSVCGAQFPKWVGQCTDCNAWNSIIEEMQIPAARNNSRTVGYTGANITEITALAQIPVTEEMRISSGLPELDRVLGGGIVSGSVILIGGDPGIGKSTLLLQTLACLSQQQHAVLYITGEESLQQVALRAKRLGLLTDKLQVLTETQVERILSLALPGKPVIMVIDSIQTMSSDMLQSAPGSVGQVRESAAKFVQFAKQTGTAIFLVGHVTKDGALAGPRVLEHMVDCVLYFEGQSDNRFRMIRAVKNRYGAVNELGVFAMSDQGLRAVNNPSAIFLSRYEQTATGSVVMATWEGTRPLLVEVQALVDESHLANPRRITVGLEQNRLAMLLAVLHRHAGVATYNQDVFVNVVGGIRVVEPGSDLALLLAVVSSLRNRPLDRRCIVFGEVGLSGEIRPVPYGQERLQEAAKQGFTSAIIPRSNAPRADRSDLKIHAVQRLSEALEAMSHSELIKP